MESNIHISEIPTGAEIKKVQTRDPLYPDLSKVEFLTSYQYNGKTVCWNEHQGFPLRLCSAK